MLYKVGEWKNYYFIYDSDRNLCRMVERTRLYLDNVILQRYEWSYPKVAMMYGINYKDTYGVIPIVEYELVINSYYVGFVMSLAILSIYSCYNEDFVERMHKRYGYMDSHVMYLQIVMKDVHLDAEHKFLAYDALKFKGGFLLDVVVRRNFDYSDAYGIIIPVQMLDTTWRIVKSHDMNALFDVYDGAFDRKLNFVDCFGKKYEYTIRHGSTNWW